MQPPTSLRAASALAICALAAGTARADNTTRSAAIRGALSGAAPVGRRPSQVVMFGSEAMFQGSFNGYPSGASGAAFDSKLVENGAIILDPGYVAGQVAAFDQAWASATPIIGGE